MRTNSRAKAREDMRGVRRSGKAFGFGRAWQAFGRAHYPEASKDDTFWASLRPSTVARERERNYPHEYHAPPVAQTSRAKVAHVCMSTPRQARRDDPNGLQLAKLIAEGKLGGQNPQRWTPTPLDFGPITGRQTGDSAFKRRLQRTHRELLQDSKWLREPVDMTAPHLQEACKRCSHINIEPHEEATCNDPVNKTGAFCAYCSATHLTRAEHGNHARVCWGDPGRKPKSISAVGTVFREDKEIKLERCGVGNCHFLSHVSAIYNTHVIFHEYLKAFAMGTPRIFLGELSKWVYDGEKDTFQPPLGILRLLGSAFRWLQRHKPECEVEYAFHYEFPADFAQRVRRFEPPPQNLPVMEDIDLFLDNHSWETAIHLTLAQLNELEHAVTRRHPQPLARMCGPRNNVTPSDANKRRKTAASPYGDVDDRAEPPAKRGHASVKEFVTANCTLSVPYDDLTEAEAAVFRQCAEQAVARATSQAPLDDTREYVDEECSTLADEEAEMERLNRDVGLVSPNEGHAELRDERDVMFMDYSASWGGSVYQTPAASSSNAFCAAIFVSDASITSPALLSTQTRTVTATTVAVSSTVTSSSAKSAEAVGNVAEATASATTSITSSTLAQDDTTLVLPENPYMADPAKYQPELFPTSPQRVTQTLPSEEAAEAAEPEETPDIDDGMSPMLGDILDAMCSNDDDFDAGKTLALAASRADARAVETAKAVCKTGSPRVATSTDVTPTATAVAQEADAERKSRSRNRSSSKERGRPTRIRGDSSVTVKVRGQEYRYLLAPDYPGQTHVPWAFQMSAYARLTVPVHISSSFRPIEPDETPSYIGVMIYLNTFHTKHVAVYLTPKSKEAAFARGECSLYAPQLSDNPMEGYIAQQGEITPMKLQGKELRIYLHRKSRPLSRGYLLSIDTRSMKPADVFAQRLYLLKRDKVDTAVIAPCL